MKQEIFLWLTVVFFNFYFAGHLFDLLANVPNWKSGDIADVSKYRDFYGKASPKNYFLPFVVGTPVISLLSLILVWNSGNDVRIFLLISTLLSLLIFVAAVKYFVPINEYILTSKKYDEVKLKKLVSGWVKIDYIRLALLGIGLLTSILALRSFLNNKG